MHIGVLKTYRTLASVCLRFLKYRLWYFCSSPIEPCSACILRVAPEDPSLEVVLVTDLVLPFREVFTDNVGEGDWCTFRLFLLLLSLIDPKGCRDTGSSSGQLLSSNGSSSAISWRCGEGCLARIGLSSREGTGGEGGAALPSAGPHQGKQHFQTPTSVTNYSPLGEGWNAAYRYVQRKDFQTTYNIEHIITTSVILHL